MQEIQKLSTTEARDAALRQLCRMKEAFIMDPGAVPADVKDRESYESWKNATARFKCKYVSDIDASRAHIRERNLAMEYPARSPYDLEYTRQARRLVVDQANILEPRPTTSSFAGSWQDTMLSSMTTSHAAVDNAAMASRVSCLQRTNHERALAFQERRAELEKERTLFKSGTKEVASHVRQGYLQPASPLSGVDVYGRTGMMEANPHLGVANSCIAWKEQLAARDARLRDLSQYQTACEHRQRYIAAGMHGYTPALV